MYISHVSKSKVEQYLVHCIDRSRDHCATSNSRGGGGQNWSNFGTDERARILNLPQSYTWSGKEMTRIHILD